jgi:hypothetical protein
MHPSSGWEGEYGGNHKFEALPKMTPCTLELKEVCFLSGVLPSIATPLTTRAGTTGNAYRGNRLKL